MPQANMPYIGIDAAYDVPEGFLELDHSTITTTEMRTNGGAQKADIGKPKLSLIDPEFSRGMARVLEMGEKKYGEKDWMQGMNYSWLMDSAKRHIEEFAEGKELDEESGQPPLINAACCLMMLCWFERNGFSNMRFDDRRFTKVSSDDDEKPEGKERDTL